MFPVPPFFGITCLLSHCLLVLCGINHILKNSKEECGKFINVIEHLPCPKAWIHKDEPGTALSCVGITP